MSFASWGTFPLRDPPYITATIQLCDGKLLCCRRVNRLIILSNLLCDLFQDNNYNDKNKKKKKKNNNNTKHTQPQPTTTTTKIYKIHIVDMPVHCNQNRKPEESSAWITGGGTIVQTGRGPGSTNL